MQKYQANACDGVLKQGGSGSNSLDPELQALGREGQALCPQSEGEERAEHPVEIIRKNFWVFGARFIILVWFKVSFYARLAVMPIFTFMNIEEGASGQSIGVTAGNSYLS